MAALVGVFVVALVGLGVAVEQGDRRVDVPDVLVPSVEGTGEDAAREHLTQVLPRILASKDAMEGVQSFLERREARFTGE